MSENILRIEKLENGYTVCITDSKIQEKNRGKGPWQDPEKEYAFKDAKEVADFVAKNLDVLEPPMSDADIYKTSFGDAVKGDKEND